MPFPASGSLPLLDCNFPHQTFRTVNDYVGSVYVRSCNICHQLFINAKARRTAYMKMIKHGFAQVATDKKRFSMELCSLH